MYFVQSVTKHLPSQPLNDILTSIINLILSLYKMPEYVMSYFEALRKWNLGGAAWCIPRKNTILQTQLNKIRTGEVESKQELAKKEIEQYKKKPKQKKEKTSMNIKI
jgi:hypothetical protein